MPEILNIQYSETLEVDEVVEKLVDKKLDPKDASSIRENAYLINGL